MMRRHPPSPDKLAQAELHQGPGSGKQRQAHAMPLRHLHQPLLSPEAGRVSASEPRTPTTHAGSTDVPPASSRGYPL